MTPVAKSSKASGGRRMLSAQSTRNERRVSGWMAWGSVLLALAVLAVVQVAMNRPLPSAVKASSERERGLTPAVRPASPSGLAQIMNSENTSTLTASLSPRKAGTDGGSVSSSTGLAPQTRIAETPGSAGSNSHNTVSGPLATLEVAQAVMATVELDFGGTVPTVAAALLDIERRYQPDDGKGRTFAILDAYGEGTWTGKLHLSMHLSAEKPGIASLIFKRTGETLWSSRIVRSKNPKKSQFTGKNLSIYIDDGAGKLLTVDGSNNPTWIMEAVVREKGVLLDTVWLNGVEHEVTFIYSACGCPVKVMARRESDRVVRTKDLPVMFPDDPAVVEVIARLMRW